MRKANRVRLAFVIVSGGLGQEVFERGVVRVWDIFLVGPIDFDQGFDVFRPASLFQEPVDDKLLDGDFCLRFCCFDICR